MESVCICLHHLVLPVWSKSQCVDGRRLQKKETRTAVGWKRSVYGVGLDIPMACLLCVCCYTDTWKSDATASDAADRQSHRFENLLPLVLYLARFLVAEWRRESQLTGRGWGGEATGRRECLGSGENLQAGYFRHGCSGLLIGARRGFCNLRVVSDLLLVAPSPPRRLQSFRCFVRSQSLPRAGRQTSSSRADQAILPNGVLPAVSTLWSSEDLVLCQISSQDHAGPKLSRARIAVVARFA